jgi:hypothetical protein
MIQTGTVYTSKVWVSNALVNQQTRMIISNIFFSLILPKNLVTKLRIGIKISPQFSSNEAHIGACA